MVLSGLAGLGICRFFSRRSNTAAVSRVLLPTGWYFTEFPLLALERLVGLLVTVSSPMIGVKDSL